MASRAVVANRVDKSDPQHVKRQMKLAKRSTPVPNEWRNFDERMAAKIKSRTSQSTAIAPSTFVVAAPTFQLYVVLSP